MVESGGFDMFIGEYHHNMDDKNRLIVPSKFREKLGEHFIVTRGIENCLFVYSEEDWEKIVKKLETLPFTKKDAREFMRFFLSGATDLEFDKQGRISIATPLVNYANIKKECVIVGVGERLEIWAAEAWENFFNTSKNHMADVAENLFDESVVI